MLIKYLENLLINQIEEDEEQKRSIFEEVQKYKKSFKLNPIELNSSKATQRSKIGDTDRTERSKIK